jgi:hypothetical protein
MMTMQAGMDIKRNGIARPYKPQDRRTASRVAMVRNASVCALWQAVLPVMWGVVMRPQGGGGVDHLAKVQQRKAQTDSLILHSLSPTLWNSPAKSISLYMSPLSSSWISFSNKTPRVLVTLLVSSLNYNI